MKLALISDVHDHVWHLRAALSAPQVQACDELWCCGDLCSPFALAMMGDLFDKPIHVVLGNNDADTFRMMALVAQRPGFAGRVQVHGEYYVRSWNEMTLAMNHYDGIAADLAASGKHRYVFFGHNHKACDDTAQGSHGETRLLNPGSIMGMTLAAGKPEPAPHSCCTIDMATDRVDWWEVKADSFEFVSWEGPE